MRETLTRRPLGNTGLMVSQLGLGTVKLGRDQGVKYPHQFKIPDDREAASIIALARDLGINLIDTAPAYGNSEERLGTLLKGQRQDWIICSKAGEEFSNGESSHDFSATHLRYSVERSLRRLNTDYIDILLLHSDGRDRTIVEGGALETLAQLKKEGLIRAIGMSSKTVEGGLLAAKQSDCMMVTYNLQEREEEPVIDYCHQHNKGVLLKKVLASGHIAAGDKADALQQSMDFVFSHPGVTSAIVGTINPKHLRQNVDALTGR
ncbi:aldo/keto reductase [Gilvimarinus sp. F26214L]|uniref:aldo/keto reductase n=1 Tax=Gilvimarinus sp. DZF01 TaxID=3461371 RepID=UPI0040454478